MVAEKTKLTPLACAVRAFGSESEIARVCGITRGAVNLWKSSGGRVPAKWQGRLLGEARKRNAYLTAEHLVG